MGKEPNRKLAIPAIPAIVQSASIQGQPPGWANVGKVIIRGADLPGAGLTPYKLGLGITGEIKIYADMPGYYSIDNPGSMQGPVAEVTFRGEIQQVYLTRVGLYNIGRVVVYYAQPSFGAGFKRETPEDKLGVDYSMPVLSWPAGVSSADTSAVPLPGSGNQPQEAWYMLSLSWLRDGGDISTISYVENESGLNFSLFRHRFTNPVDRGTIHFQRPIRLSSGGIWRITGSVEAANTNTYIVFNAVII